MKKFLKKSLVTALAALVFTSATAMAPTATEVTAAPNNVTEREVYTIMDNFNYRLEEAFAESPDTMEAWVKMPNGSLGGTIMGNLEYASHNYDGTVGWHVDAIGRVKIDWDNGNFKYTFKNAHVNDGEWHHVAVVRDAEAKTFSLYLDGELKDTKVSDQDDADNGQMPMNIGVDYQAFSTKKTPFEGYIKQVTVYTGAISQDRILSDMQTADITDDNEGTLLGNWNLGEEWTKRVVEETSGNGNDAKLASYGKYVGFDNSDFEYDYSFIVVPDVQTCVRYRYSRYLNMMQWVADSADDLNIEFLLQVGDLSDVGSNETLYANAASGLALLDNKVPYSFVPGNHDYDDNARTRNQVYYDTHFPYAKHSKLPGFGGAYKEGSMANTYYVHEISDDVKYVVLNLEFGPRMSVLRWAGRVCEMYPQHRIIVSTHAYMGANGTFLSDGEGGDHYGVASCPGGATSGQQIYDYLVKRHSNIFMAVSGHVCHDDTIMREDVGENGNTVRSWLIDGQTALHNNGDVGEDMMMIFLVNEAAKTMRGYYYSPEKNAVYNIQNMYQFNFADELNPAIGA